MDVICDRVLDGGLSEIWFSHYSLFLQCMLSRIKLYNAEIPLPFFLQKKKENTKQKA